MAALTVSDIPPARVAELRAEYAAMRPAEAPATEAQLLVRYNLDLLRAAHGGQPVVYSANEWPRDEWVRVDAVLAYAQKLQDGGEALPSVLARLLCPVPPRAPRA